MAKTDRKQAKGSDMRVVVFKEENLWVAQALEHDICAQAADLKTVRARLQMTVSLERAYSASSGKEPFEGIEAAPKHFHDLWQKSSEFTDSSSDDDDGIEMALCA